MATYPYSDVLYVAEYPNGDGLIHIERPRHHLTLCSDMRFTSGWELTKRFPTCLACIALLPEYYAL